MYELTVRVDSWNDVVVVLVDERLHGCIGSVLGEQLPREILSRHGSDPFACMDSAVNKDRRLRSLTTRSPNMDAGQGATLNGRSSCEDLGLGRETSLQVSQERQMVSVRVVSREPCLAGDFAVLVLAA